MNQGVVVYGKEHFFGGGVVSVPHEEFLATYHMQPVEMVDLGETEIPEDIFNEFLRQASNHGSIAGWLSLSSYSFTKGDDGKGEG